MQLVFFILNHSNYILSDQEPHVARGSVIRQAEEALRIQFWWADMSSLRYWNKLQGQSVSVGSSHFPPAVLEMKSKVRVIDSGFRSCWELLPDL